MKNLPCNAKLKSIVMTWVNVETFGWEKFVKLIICL